MIRPDNRWAWRALLILVPLYYNPLSRWQYEPDKVALVILLAALLLGNTIRQGNLPRLARSGVMWAMLAYVLIRWLAAIQSIAPAQSLWGDSGWRSGFWLTLAGVIVFVLARQQFSTPERRDAAITAILIGSGLVAAYGVGIVLNPFDHEDVVRTASTMAHPNLLAAYLAMVMPLAAARVLAAKRRAWWAGLLALQSLCLIFTYSRAGWLAALSGLAVLGIVQFWMAGRHRLAQGFCRAAGDRTDRAADSVAAAAAARGRAPRAANADLVVPLERRDRANPAVRVAGQSGRDSGAALVGLWRGDVRFRAGALSAARTRAVWRGGGPGAADA